MMVTLLIGCIVGFLSGLLGKGGSAITTPALQVFAGVSPFAALASPLPATLPTTLSASLAYRGKDLVSARVAWGTILMGIPSTVGGSLLSHYLRGYMLMVLTAVFVLSLGLSFFISTTIEADQPVAIAIPFWKIAVVALPVGFLSGLLANSGGVLFGPLFIRFLKMPTKKALATSLVVAAGLALPGTLAHWYLGHIDWQIVILLSVGSIPCSYLGARLALRLKSAALEKIFALMLVLFGAFDLFYSLYH